MTAEMQTAMLPSKEIINPYSVLAVTPLTACTRLLAVKNVYNTTARESTEAAKEMPPLNLNSVFTPATAAAVNRAARGKTGVLKPARFFPAPMLAQGRMLPTANKMTPASETSFASVDILRSVSGILKRELL